MSTRNSMAKRGFHWLVLFLIVGTFVVPAVLSFHLVEMLVGEVANAWPARIAGVVLFLVLGPKAWTWYARAIMRPILNTLRT